MVSEAGKSDEKTTTILSTIEKRNLALLILSYTFTMASLVLLVGTSSSVVLSMEKEGDDYTKLATLSYGLFMVGMSLISLFTTQIFRHGRKFGFFVSNLLGMSGAVLGVVALKLQIFPLLLFSYVPLGSAVGIGNYLRFAAVEVMPMDWRAPAVTLVLSGGVISAFLGPEAANITKSILKSIPFANVFIVVGIFNLAMMVLISMVQFPSTQKTENNTKESKISLETKPSNDPTTLVSILKNHKFYIPAAVASLSWGIMAMPMIITRVAMDDAGYAARSSLTVIELHFLGMFSPGFVSGKIIKKKGEIFALMISISLFILAHVFGLVCLRKDDGGSLATWILGLFIIGTGWNFGFASGTVWLTKVCDSNPSLKTKIQACNDFIMFAVTGISGLSTGYIYDAQKSFDPNITLRGWRSVHYVSLSGIVILISVAFVGHFWSKKEDTPSKSSVSRKDSDEQDETIRSNKVRRV